jgi:hypothetical protein
MPDILKSNTVTRFKKFHIRLTEQFTESQAASCMPQQAICRGLLKGFSQLVSVSIEASQKGCQGRRKGDCLPLSPSPLLSLYAAEKLVNIRVVVHREVLVLAHHGYAHVLIGQVHLHKV